MQVTIIMVMTMIIIITITPIVTIILNKIPTHSSFL